jgi:CopG family nickel-responsive transcriptional regulator
MAGLERISMTIEKDLIEKFDEMRTRNNLPNRSEAFRDLIRQRLVEEEWEQNSIESVATVTLVYDHHKKEISDKLVTEAHHHHGMVMASMHIHLDAHNCLEVIALKGMPEELREFGEHLIGIKGVLHGKFVMGPPFSK